eukprot:COSAG02_NODE_12960_length_1467_cov_1.543129_2_plen_116_part_00
MPFENSYKHECTIPSANLPVWYESQVSRTISDSGGPRDQGASFEQSCMICLLDIALPRVHFKPFRVSTPPEETGLIRLIDARASLHAAYRCRRALRLMCIVSLESFYRQSYMWTR